MVGWTANPTVRTDGLAFRPTFFHSLGANGGSLPARIDKNLLASWRSRMAEPQDRLLDRLIAALPHQGICTIDDEIKQRLADAVRAHYKAHPESLDLQASGNAVPPTIDNHR